MRKPGRRIEFWEVNERTGEVRKKGPSRYRQHWKSEDVTEVEIRLVAEGVYGARFVLHLPNEVGRDFETLDAARLQIRKFGQEVAEAAAEPWREIIIMDGARHFGDIKAFGYDFNRAAVSGERIKYKQSDGTYGNPEPLRNRGMAVIDYSPGIWQVLLAASDLNDWVYERSKYESRRHRAAMGGSWDWTDEFKEETEEQRGARAEFILEYVHSISVLVRELQRECDLEHQPFVKRIRKVLDPAEVAAQYENLDDAAVCDHCGTSEGDLAMDSHSLTLASSSVGLALELDYENCSTR